MEIIFIGAILLIVSSVIRLLLNKYTQTKILKKLKNLLSALDQEDRQISTQDFLYFLSKNTELPQNEYFKKEFEQFLNLYSKESKEKITIKNIFLIWISILENNILYIPNKNLSVREYQHIYELENTDIFNKIEKRYKVDQINGTDNNLNKKKLFYLRINNSIELFLNKYIKELRSLLPFYWFAFSPLFLKKISKINWRTWFLIKKILKINE